MQDRKDGGREVDGRRREQGKGRREDGSKKSRREEGGWDGGGHRGLPGNYLLEVIGVYLGIICWGS